LAILALSCGKRAPKVEPVIPADPALEARIDKILSGMSLEEKAGQLVQLNISVLEDDTHEAIDPAKLDEVSRRFLVAKMAMEW
jgi:beta-glucosidase